MSILNLQPHDLFRLPDAAVAPWRDQIPDFGPLGMVTYLRTYARQKPDGTTETWPETVRRVVDGCFTYQKWHCRRNNLPWSDAKALQSAVEMYDLIFRMRFLPPGRGLWIAGARVVNRLGITPLVNCSAVTTQYLAIDFTGPFCQLADFSMLGVGVGFDTLGAGTVTIQAPVASPQVYVVADSREGWVDAIRVTLKSYVGKGELPARMDYSKVRPAGTPIKGFGGTASGPGPLAALIEGMRRTLDPLIGHPITSVAIVDLMNRIGVCVVAGNVRRSSELALGQPDDVAFCQMKDPQRHREALLSHRWASNNSIAATVGMDYGQFAAQTASNGEPGYVWLENCRNYGRMIDGYCEGIDAGVKSVNPCFAPGTLVQTKEGHFQIEMLIGKCVSVWNGDEWIDTDSFRVTNTNQPIVKVTLHDGSSVRCTEYHEFIFEDGRRVMARDLRPGDRLATAGVLSHGVTTDDGAYAKGFLVGDGGHDRNKNIPIMHLYEPKWVCQGRILRSLRTISRDAGVRSDALEPSIVPNSAPGRKTVAGLTSRSKQLLPWVSTVKESGLPSDVFAWNEKSKCELIAGLFDSDGTFSDTTNGFMYQLTSASKRLLESVQDLLKTIGVNSTLRLSKAAGAKNFINHGGVYQTQDLYRLTISQRASVVLASKVRFSRLGDASAKRCTYNTRHRWNVVASVERDGIEPVVFCCTVPRHQISLTCGISVGQCGEVPLESAYIGDPDLGGGIGLEVCNLSEVFPSRHATYEEFRRTLKFAYMWCKSISLLPSHHPHTNAIILKNRRLGVSVSGIADAMQRHGRRAFLDWLDRGYQHIRHLDEVYSDWLGVPRSIKLTTVKPSGSIALLAGVSAGIHYPHAEYYYRTIRMAKNSPLLGPLRAAGYRIEDSITDTSTAVVYFPMREQHFDRAKADVSMWEQLQNAADLQRYWSDNAVSVTVTFVTDEAKDIARALSCYETQLKSVSFLPLADHQYAQAPYQTITKEDYQEAISQIRQIQWAQDEQSGRDRQFAHDSEEKFCTGDSCAL